MTDAERHFGRESRVGGAACLDFVNTLPWRGTGATIERLTTYDDLLSWAAYGNLVEAPQAARLRELAQAQPTEAADVLRRAWALREGLHRIVTAQMQRREPAEDDVALLNGELGAALAHTYLTRDGDGYRLGWRGLDEQLDAPLWRVTRS
ncbi:MAG TPA: ABATE domain-containing protein, partial [Ktedonobacterales bacterium]